MQNAKTALIEAENSARKHFEDGAIFTIVSCRIASIISLVNESAEINDGQLGKVFAIIQGYATEANKKMGDKRICSLEKPDMFDLAVATFINSCRE